jgi:PAS domain S-box-containing protein
MKSELSSELDQLRVRLEEAEETLAAIRSGEVDALVVSGPQGDQVYTLRGADHSYRVLLENMNEGAATLLPDGSVLYCNRSFAHMLKVPLEKLIGVSIKDFVAEPDQSALEDLLRQGEQEKAKTDMTFILKDGTFVPSYCSVTPVQIGDLPCLCLTATDLTEQKRADEIAAFEKLARSILEYALDAIVVCDQSGTIIQASRAARELSGGNVLGRPFEEVFPLRFADGTVLGCSADAFSVAACLGGRTLQNVEARLEPTSRKKLDLLVSAGPLRDSRQRVLGCLFTLNDITERKQAEDVLRQSEEKLRQQTQELEQQLIASGRLVSLGEITASMAHEFNNPLGIIMGFAQDLLSDIDPSNPHHRSLKIIDDEARRCEKIIQDLLQFARPKSTDLCPTNVKQVIEKTMGLITNHLYKQKIEANLEIEEPLPKVQADPQELEQVLVNLYLNAIDAMPDGGTLTVRSKRLSGSDGKEVGIFVCDTGFGPSRSTCQWPSPPAEQPRSSCALGKWQIETILSNDPTQTTSRRRAKPMKPCRRKSRR